MGTNKRELKRLAQKRKRLRNIWLSLTIGGIALILVAFFILRGMSGSTVAAIEVQGAPSLKVDKEKVDLGDKKLGSTVAVSFVLTNVGDQPLRFTKEPYIEVVEGC